MLIQRIITALILAPLFVWAIFAMPNHYFAQLLLVFVALGAWEFSRLIKFKRWIVRLLLVAGIVACALIIQNNAQIIAFVLYLSVLWWMVNLYWVLSYPNKTNLWFNPLIVRIISGVLLLVPTWVALITLQQQYSAEYFLLLMLIIWGADSGAYFTGKAIGKQKLAPKVSPGKSIEGVIGGIGVALVVMVMFLQYQNIAINQYLSYLLLTIVVASVSVLGDLFESLFKRVSNIKDSGRILPGHGGVLDRIDSLTAAAPFFLLGLNLI
ncbi:phosphatidate cytidylyltransferase [Abyssogena phaseoliformis symbiont OG214]|uniref:phosphatidate cytidylyltransferase n=1 Tax=Abyssogena phaseoliformis symbiont TaxID=596095 RepID=UPI0019152DF4|nr:phosphatidate cytidylyltransferase [Abyssogena phaseoliformis symbiont]MBW5288751.1 Phosphatidate cytidylyltransferase [Candidatus Ruthia sp. Apha_13_S6]BBB22235.1 phosphatidate cytidylyltransferase [Abyssogena phaseoliformis symbiont OG214]